MNKMITIPYDEYLDMEKCKNAIDNIRGKLRRGDNFTLYTHTETGNKSLTVYGGEKLFEVIGLLEDGYFEQTTHVEIYK